MNTPERPGATGCSTLPAGRDNVPPCINEVGAQMGILVNGMLTDAAVTVGARQNGGADEAFQFDVAIP